MVGLSVVLEAQKLGVCSSNGNNKTQVINKATTFMLNSSSSSSKPYSPPPSSSSSTVSPPPSFSEPFLDQCFLCRNRLLPGKDIYMYKGDRGFCSVECRYKQIFMDEEEIVQRGIRSLAAMKGPTSSASSPSSSSTASSRGHRKVRPRNRAGGFTY